MTLTKWTLKKIFNQANNEERKINPKNQKLACWNRMRSENLEEKNLATEAIIIEAVVGNKNKTFL